MTDRGKTYGGSLYDLALEECLGEKILADITLIADTFEHIPEYRKLLCTQAVPKEERRQLLKEAWSDRVHRYTLNFLCLLCDNDMIGELGNCAAEYRARYNKDNNILAVTAFSAVPLDSRTEEKLLAAIEKKTGRKVELTTKLEESLIGGLRLEMDGKAYDGSVAYHLEAIRQLLQGNA